MEEGPRKVSVDEVTLIEEKPRPPTVQQRYDRLRLALLTNRSLQVNGREAGAQGYNSQADAVRAAKRAHRAVRKSMRDGDRGLPPQHLQRKLALILPPKVQS